MTSTDTATAQSSVSRRPTTADLEFAQWKERHALTIIVDDYSYQLIAEPVATDAYGSCVYSVYRIPKSEAESDSPPPLSCYTRMIRGAERSLDAAKGHMISYVRTLHKLRLPPQQGGSCDEQQSLTFEQG